MSDERATPSNAAEERSVLYRKEDGSYAIEIEVRGYAPEEAISIVQYLMQPMTAVIPVVKGGFDA